MSEGKKFYKVWNKTNSLFAFWFGACDIGYRKNGTLDEIIDNLFNIISKIYDIGARNILILEAPPIYRNPFRSKFYKEKKCTYENCDQIKNDVYIFNNNIIKNSKIFFDKYSDTNIIIYDTVSKFENIISECNMYKFKNCTHAWSSVKNRNKNNINEYFWANSHLTSLANKYIAKDINDLLNSLNS